MSLGLILDLILIVVLLNYILQLQSDKQDTSSSVVQVVFMNLVRMGQCDGKKS